MRMISFGLGEPDFPTPANIVAAGNSAALQGKTKYSQVGGIPELLEAVQHAFRRDCAIEYNRDELIAGNGSIQLLSNAAAAIIKITGRNKILTIAPCWRKYRGIISFAGGTTETVTADAKENFRITPEAIKARLTPETAAVILNNPCNPTGRVIDNLSLKQMGDDIVGNGSYIIYDQIYASLSYAGTIKSMGSFSERIRNRTITIDSCSKKYAMCGYRIGYCGAGTEVISAMKEIQDNTTWTMNTAAQYAGVEALRSDESQHAASVMRAAFAHRRDLMHRRLQAMGFAYAVPEGGLSFFVRIPRHIPDSEQFADLLIKHAHVQVNPGRQFACEGYARFTFCCSYQDIIEGFDRLHHMNLLARAGN